ncbi:hypothetical protein JCGZ_11177 [Jatropha curcas]|uniref:DEAD-box ATP-dependent RNA helicase FANCM n=1 Tax=Jatropha curcas TaxID=180498 RepID=A0A067KRB2_JATCU|nr:hypothetical protein JCGZ_11177 [Jatropha curcas]
MTSTSPLHVPDNDDDEFDWEAAVREIDVACQSANNPSTSLPNNFASSSSSHSRPLNGIYKNSNLCFTNKIVKKSGACKQSTLDMFIGKGLGPGPRPGNSMVDDLNQQVGVEGNDDERASYVEIDPEAAKTWIYPVNVPLRDYQLAMTKTALFSNTLVALPTGLGKTLIAAVVMYNYFRWFPYGKIVFAAPSRPLVMQQIEACHNIVGIPQEWTIDMTGQLSPTKRACFWKTKRVFFVTPQVLEKDIQSGTCLVRYLVCLVIDEAHRALGNYSYCVAVRELMAVPVQLRILALTATPGSKQQAIQHIIDNLHISTLEYRNEDDPDVSPYVHNRKIEMIEVALGKDAVDVNKQLLEVIRPYVARLSAIGLLHNRDYKTFSPPDLLNSRDKFRRAPPPELPQNKYGEIEAYFAGLITLYHIRKLLSSHGIRPAYEMLEEKLKQGPFARLMTRNEDIRKVKLSMQQSLSHGAPSPKLSKMLEVLVDHFKTKDPQNSRVIIFSNFRGSVRDIMNALTNIGDIVKATEFIGQSSGKALKGQSQKVQQAVLEKFRAGKYNVIVATSIGEEGLDIMEVDLVICFDANVSPLRMIQRMGRTGRKHDGRGSLVLACEGSELKGYMRKQANSRAIKKHMHNGGINSFNFHPSPRMIPHIFKPEVQFVKLSIEQYIPRGKKVKDDTAIQTPVFRTKLNGEEAALITKYFKLTGEQSWRPSLIAFPHFQAFPSRVHKVMHSYRTNMLIDTMQYLQNLSFSTKGRAFFIEDEISSGKCLGVDAFEKEHIDKEDPLSDGSPATKSLKKVTDYELSATDCDVSPRKTELHNVMDFHEESPPAHSYLFGSDFVSVNALGNVIILSVPVLPMREALHSKCTNASTTLPLDCLEKNSHMRTPCKDSKEVTVEGKSSADLIPSWMQCETNVTLAIPKSNVQQDKILDRVETAPETPGLKKRLSNERDCADEALDRLEINGPSSQHVEYNDNAELSPRLTNMIQSGIVPESPINDIDASAMKLDVELLPKSPIPGKNETAINVKGRQRTLLASINNEIQTPILTENNPAAEETNTPLVNPTENSCSKDWLISSGDKSETVEQLFVPNGKPVLGKRKQTGNIFIEEEAERSLLSQSPMERESSSYITATPDCGTSMSRMNESKSSSVKTLYSFQTPYIDSSNKFAGRDSGSFQMDLDRMSEAKPHITTNFLREKETMMESRKRKLSFCMTGSIPAINLEQEFSLQSDAARKESFQQDPAENLDANGEMFHDDQFFANLDLDAVEAQATMLLKHKSESSVQNQDVVPKLSEQNFDLQSSPTFDLGIG